MGGPRDRDGCEEGGDPMSPRQLPGRGPHSNHIRGGVRPVVICINILLGPTIGGDVHTVDSSPTLSNRGLLTGRKPR